MKRFVIDTCIFIDDPECIYRFEDNDIVVPFKVIEELDKHKDASGSKGEGARHALRNIYNLTQQGKVSKGVRLSTGGMFRVDMTDVTSLTLPIELDLTDPDNVILAVAWANKKKSKAETILITNDINLKIKSESLNLQTEKYENRTVKKAEHLFSPYHLLEISVSDLDEYLDKKWMYPPDGVTLFPNEYVLIRSHGTKQSGLGRYSAQTKRIEVLKNADRETFGVKGRNLEQRFALDLLLDDNVKLVSLLGKAGTGKTILALAAGLQKVLEERVYRKIVIARPIVSLSKAHEIGFIPGTMQEKLTPWMQPIIDNLEVILDTEEGNQDINLMLERKTIEFSALGYIRGRSIENAFIIIDEAQQLLPRESKATITRVGGNSKIVLTGDPFQVDHQYLDELTNGLSYVVERFKNQAIAGHTILTKCERSSLANIAADIL